MKKYKVSVVGLFCENGTATNGQTVLTTLLADTLAEVYGGQQVNRVSYKNWKKKSVGLLFSFIRAIVQSENLLICPDKNAIKVIAPLSYICCRLFRTKIHYKVLGGWLPFFTESKRYYRKVLCKFDTIFVETNFLKKELVFQGFQNLVILPNFKPVEIIENQPETFSEPYKCFFLSRVMKEKGIEELITAIKEVNRDKVKFELDIFGPFDHGYETEFSTLAKDFPDFIKYKGFLEPDKTSAVIHPYFLQIFPTKYKTEGFPGCVIDSFAAGVPVLASHWLSFDDVISEGETGMSYQFDSKDDLVDKLEKIYEEPQEIIRMRKNCVCEARKYLPESVIQIMSKRF